MLPKIQLSCHKGCDSCLEIIWSINCLKNVRKAEKEAVKIYQKQGHEAVAHFLNKFDNAHGKMALDMASKLKIKLRGKYLDNSVVK